MGLAFSVVFFSQFCFEWKIISSPLDAVVAAVAVVDDDVVVEVVVVVATGVAVVAAAVAATAVVVVIAAVAATAVVVVIAAVAASAAGGESIEVADWVVTNQDE